ncbi:zinc metalloprotease HtpX [Candidatus Gottesmanbacteria bacterium RIFCSPHIGHO2_02_FULL_39_11]|uniref:Protease HtpX homolog n=1 Tax=Candidatus Gottesmanbacteria bacterium RIFCSPHIGHO2_02_FULL_39_11 TaxID=1798382 RepID=A0A1F5ZWM4_9BACT|nr:MAG: zinc metalloprotease HtpX [Candidatus Gottesmanbacteria bacterium RIFCSPHIGHO2_02_FULL_39_11]
MVNVYENVSENKFKSTLTVGLFIGFITVAVYLISYSFNLDSSFLVIALIFSLTMSGATYFWGDKMVLALNGAKPAKREDYFDFYTVTQNLSMADQIPMPKIYVIDSPALNAFATGRDPHHAVVCATTGLLRKLNRSELEAVIAHELSHVKNFDTRLLMMVSLLIGSLSILTNIAIQNSFFGGRRGRDSRGEGNLGAVMMILGLLLAVFAPFIAKLIQLAVSRRREYLADASGVKLTRQPQSLIDALQKISGDPNILSEASPATASLYINNPFKGKSLSSLFSTHPPIEDRIRVLKNML